MPPTWPDSLQQPRMPSTKLARIYPYSTACGGILVLTKTYRSALKEAVKTARKFQNQCWIIRNRPGRRKEIVAGCTPRFSNDPAVRARFTKVVDCDLRKPIKRKRRR